MWMLMFLPDSLLYFFVICTILLGIAAYAVGTFIQYFPPLMPYEKVLKISGAVLTVLGIYFYGGYAVEMEWREKVKELEAKVTLAEEKSKTVNAQIEVKIVEKTKVIHDLQVVYKDKIVEVTKIIDAQCVVAPETLDILNKAAETPGASK
jgi:hypothetical protein